MSDFTYEYSDQRRYLETFEWDNTWIEHTENETADRVLYIGDSISCATKGYATNLGGGKILFDNFGSSKAIDNPYLKDAIRLFALQQERRIAVMFNNGLHGWHLDDCTEYSRYYEDTVKFLIEQFAKTPVYLVLTTHIADTERDIRVQKRNECVKQIAKKYSLEIIDFYTPTAKAPQYISNDGVHLTGEGYQALAAIALNTLAKL